MGKQQKKYNNRQDQPSSIELGKIQPQARELEEAVLGAVMIEKEALGLIDGVLSESDFYDHIHQTIFRAISNLSSKRNPVDMLTVVEELRRMGELEIVGGPVYISSLTDKIASAAHVEFHAKIIKQKAIARNMINIASLALTKAYDDTVDIQEILEEHEKLFTDLVVSGTTGCKSLNMEEAIRLTLDQASENQTLRSKGIDPFINTGLESLNKNFNGGWRAPNLIIIGARPSMGKTQHALNFAKAAGSSKKNVLFISIEMTVEELINRYLLEDNRISSYNLETGQMNNEEWTAINEKAGELWNLNLHIADSHEIRYLNNIRSEARRLHRKGKLDMMIIDYLGLIRTNQSFSQRYLEIGYITGELKALCKELSIPIILLSQLSRPQKGTIKEPQLEDLRESGDIEQDADIVLFIHKPDYYNKDVTDSKGVPWKNRGKLIIAKNRKGSRNESVIFHHDPRYKKIWDDYNPQTSIDYDPSPIRPNEEFVNQTDDTPF